MHQDVSFVADLRSVLPLRAKAIRVRSCLGQPQNSSSCYYKTSSKYSLFPINECKGFFVPAQTITLVGLYPTIARDT